MRHREITREQVKAVYAILVEECGWTYGGPHAEESFIWTVATTDKSDPRKICNEYRFCGALGFGGKFRNNGNNNNVPYVDCYPEHETPERLAMIERANARLAELFGPAPHPAIGKGGVDG
jgi:hypothetical protein